MKKMSILFCLVCAIFLIAPHSHGQVPFPDRTGFGGQGFGSRDFVGEAIARMSRTVEDMDSEPTLEDAHFLGRAVAAHIFALHRPYNQNPELTRYINKILQTLVINSSRPAAFRGYFVVVLDTPEFNAFASPGGHIFLTRGLVEAATSEDMLAAVIAHELAHVILDHGLSMIAAMSFHNEAAAVAGRAADFAGNTPQAARLMSFRDSVSVVVDALVRSGFSREQEFAADRKAVEILVASGYNPRALQDMLRILQQRQGSNTGGFFDTHPPPDERIRNIEEAIRLHRVSDTSSHRQARFANSR
ncbi:MAG: M48 family metalloprotease [Treponema sp.]|nr:M48 family metalloprotease [Treponema sp.]